MSLPSTPPVATADGRPYVRDSDEPDDELAYWLPDPPCDGDRVYCFGRMIGTYRSNGNIETFRTDALPEKLANHLRSMHR